MRLKTLSCTAPITALAVLDSRIVVAGTAHYIVAVHLARDHRRRWPVLKRERVHRIVVKQEETNLWRIIVTGGKEAAVVRIRLGEGDDNFTDNLQLEVLLRFDAQDWLHDSAFLGISSLLFLTAHNSVLLYDVVEPSNASSNQSVQLVRTFNADLRPLLWGGSFHETVYARPEDVKIAGGSMLGDVVVWSLDAAAMSLDDVVEVRGAQRLEGHKGSIYHLVFSPCRRYLASCSDDRTLRVWDLSAGSETLVMTLWGHEGRVWRLAWLDDATTLVSVGEDSSLRVWTVDLPSVAGESPRYELRHSYKDVHEGKNVWSLAAVSRVDGSLVAITGGADGAIKSWELPAASTSDGPEHEGFIPLDLPANTGSLKAFTFRLESDGAHRCVFLTASGSLYSCRLSTGASTPPELLISSPDLKNVAARFHFADDGRRLFVLTNRDLVIRIDFLGGDQLAILKKRLDISVMGLAVEEASGMMAVFDKRDSSVSLINQELEQTLAISLDTSDFSPRQRTVTAMLLIPCESEILLIIGNMYGEVLLAKPSPQMTGILSSWPRVHDSAITSLRLEYTDSAVDMWRLESLGKDGFKIQHELKRQTGTWQLSTIQRIRLTRGALESTHIVDGDRRYLAMVDAQAALYDAEGERICAFQSPGTQIPHALVDSANGLTYYRLLRGSLRRQHQPRSAIPLPRRVLLPGFHGQETRCVDQIHTQGDHCLVATGAENAIMRISEIDSDGNLHHHYVDKAVPEGLKNIRWARTRSCLKLLLFASGASQAIHVWSVTITSGAEYDGSLAVLDVQSLRATTDSMKEDTVDEPRTMAMAVWSPTLPNQAGVHFVMTGSSDGRLRVFTFDEMERRLTLRAEDVSPGKCLLALCHVVVDVEGEQERLPRHLVFTGASDGHVAVQDLTSLVGHFDKECGHDDRSNLSGPVVRWQLHQSGINAIDVWVQPGGKTVKIATAGDDNAVHIVEMSVPYRGGDWRSVGHLPAAHASTIQGLRWITHDRLLSSAVDQRLNILNVSDNAVVIGDAMCLSTADCSAMTVWRMGQSRTWSAVVTGIGMEVIEIDSA